MKRKNYRPQPQFSSKSCTVIEELNTKIKEKESQLEYTSNNNIGLQIQLEISNNKNLQLNTTCKELSEKLENIESEIHKYIEELAQLGLITVQANEKNAQAEEKIHEFAIEIDKLSKNNHELLNKIKLNEDYTNSIISKANSNEESLKSRVSSLEESLLKSEHAATNLREQNRRLEKKQHELQSSLNERFSELAKMTGILELSEHKLLTTEAELEKAIDQLNSQQKANWNKNIFRLKNGKSIKNRKNEQHISLIESSGLFDETWYKEHCPNIEKTTLTPVEHYLVVGYKLGINPSASFDGNRYLKQYDDVYQEGINPLLHYILHGQHEGRAI